MTKYHEEDRLAPKDLFDHSIFKENLAYSLSDINREV